MNLRTASNIKILATLSLSLFVFSAQAQAVDPALDAMVAQIDAYQSAMETYQTTVQEVYMLKNFKNYGWGGNNYQDFASYGSGAQDWESVLKTAGSGGAGGDLGQTIQQLANQFPVTANIKMFNSAVSDPISQQYYAMQAKTALAARASSELDYKKVQEQLDYENKLRSAIDGTQSTKEALDLMNRIQVENNLIHLEMLRAQSLSNQQKALDTQGEVNSAALNAHFLNSQE